MPRPYREGGAYVNDLGEDGASRVGEAVGADKELLAAIESRYDQDNLVRVNDNIRPPARS